MRGAAPDQLPAVEHADAIGQGDRFRHVVRHQQDRLAQARLDPAELLLQLPACHRVERAEGLVHQQHRWIRGERARDADALALSARQLVGPAPGVGAGREPDQVEQLADASAHTIGVPPFEARHHGDVVGDREMRKQADLLNHVADRAPEPDRIPFARVLALHGDVAGVGEEQSIDELEDRGLARTARAHQRDDLTGLDRQREIVENGRLPSVPERHLAEVDAVHVMTIVVSAFKG